MHLHRKPKRYDVLDGLLAPAELKMLKFRLLMCFQNGSLGHSNLCSRAEIPENAWYKCYYLGCTRIH